MNIDNLEKIKPLLKRENENEFYYIQIIQRKKDIEWFTWNNRPIKDYYIFSLEQLEIRYEEIRNLCEVFNARAYIRLSRRNAEDIARDMIVNIWEAFRNKSYNHLRKIYSTVVWQSVWLDKMWIVDIDDDCKYKKDELIEAINNAMPEWDKIITELPTKSWIHLITKPFNLSEFNNIYMIDVHKNNPTILFTP